MGQGICGRTAAALTLMFARAPAGVRDGSDRDRRRREPGRDRRTPRLSIPMRISAARPCPTRFDYLVLASFADAPSLLSLSTYHFRSEAAFSTIPLTGLLRVDYRVESVAGNCRVRDFRTQTG